MLRSIPLVSSLGNPTTVSTLGSGDTIEALNDSPERLRNLYPVRSKMGASPGVSLLTTPGLEQRFSNVAAAGQRIIALLETAAQTDFYYVATHDANSGGQVDLVDGGGTPETITTAFRPFKAVSDGVSIVVACTAGTTGPGGLLLHTGGVLSTITTTVIPRDICYIDGYVIVVEEGTDKWHILGPDDFSVLGGLDNSYADSSYDELIACASNGRELFLLGSKTIEVWHNTGNAVFPFERAQGGVISKGCYSPATVQVIDGKLVWVGDDHAVYMLDGYTPRRISTRGIDAQILRGVVPRIYNFASAGSRSGIITYEDGHLCYILALEDSSPSRSLVYDVVTDVWHEVDHREVHGGWAKSTDFAGVNSAWYTAGGGRSVYRVYALYFKYDTDAGAPANYIDREAILPALNAGGHRAVMKRVVVDIRLGTCSDEAKSVLSLYFSDDFFSSYIASDALQTWALAASRSLGATTAPGGPEANRYANRQFDVRRLGTFRQRWLKILATGDATSFAAQFAIDGVYVDIEGRL